MHLVLCISRYISAITQFCYTSYEKIRPIVQFLFDQVENACQATENVASVYGPDTGFVESIPLRAIV